MRRVRARVLCGVWGVLGVGAACVLPARADEPVLHEYVPEVRPNEVAIALGIARDDSAGIDGASPSITYQGEELRSPASQAASPAPSLTATPGDGVGGESAGQRSPTFRPDRLTELEGQLDYYEAFNPSIAPFKRVSSLDAVWLDADGVTPVLGVSDARRRQLQVETPDAAPPDARPRDPFWGDVTLDFSAGRSVPLPSVAPDSRILSVQTSPEVVLRFERDAADNHFARLVSSAPGGPVRLVFLTDAPRAYFATELPELPLSALRATAPQLDARIAQRGQRLARELGIAPDASLRDAVSKLVEHFRSFEESATPPNDTGDVLADLVRARKGVCRHRAYGFVVLAQALGIASRFVQNEAHSFVEVKLPDAGFLRIDLGGAAHGMTAHGADDRPTYTPAEPDSLPRPAQYLASYSTLQHRVTGLRPTQAQVTGRWVEPRSAGDAEGSASVFTSDVSGPNASSGEADLRKPLTIALGERRDAVLRGQKLSLGGRITSESGAGVADLRVEISIASTQRNQRMLLGVTVTDAQGYFRAALGVPPDLAVGDYRLVVLTPGDARFLPVVAE